MTANLSFWWAARIDSTGRAPWRPGDLVNPVKEVAIADTYREGGDSPEVITLEPLEQRKVWDYTDNPDGLNAFILQTEDGGWFEVCQVSDFPTSSTDPTPLGTCLRNNATGHSCHLPFIMSSVVTRGHATVGTHNGKTDGKPGCWGAGSATARVHEVWVYNPSETDSITLQKHAAY